MNTTMRNLTLTAAALAALTVIAPKAAAQEHARGGGRGNNAPQQQHQSRSYQRPQAPRQEARGYDRGERHESREHAYGGNRGYGNYGGYGYRGGYGGYGGYGRAYVAPVRPVVRYTYASPFRIFSGFRFYSACPGPDYVYIANYGWVMPPFFGAVWIPGHYDIEGFWIDGFWR